MATKNKIRRNDHNRVLITETLPYEMPVIYSSDGLYDRIKNMASVSEFERNLIEKIIIDRDSEITRTKPYLYKIRKNTLECRRLSLLHPASQWRIKEFYQKYSKLMLYFCSISPSSIRSPRSIASTFFSKGSWENVYKYKSNNVSSDSLDGYAKHAPSFFSYKGYDRLYKFFNSKDYFNLEKKFSVQMTLDVSKCFDSIYTHSISWATKEKEFVKKNLRKKTFGEEFDVTIRHGNYNETNGIPIGPEVSRVFAEIIFQKIDVITFSLLSESGMRFGFDYVVRRYVDDVYIFGLSNEIAEAVYVAYSDSLMKFNLHVNKSKQTTIGRPFTTKKSTLISGASSLANSFFDLFLEADGIDKLIPRKIHDSWRLSRSFVNSVKVLCSSNESNYDETSSFLISSITERVKKLINVDDSIDGDQAKGYVNAIIVMLDSMFFMYSVAPSVSASYKLSTSIILIIRFTRQRMPSSVDDVFHKIYDLVNHLFLGHLQDQKIARAQGFIHLELINILLAAKELEDPYLIPESVIEKSISDKMEMSYFTVTSLFFYIKDLDGYGSVRGKLIAYLKKQLSDLTDISTNSEKAHLLLDMLSCPYVPLRLRGNWIRNTARQLSLPLMSPTAIGDTASSMENNHWQVDWSDLDLLNSLEKKELKRAY